MNICGAGTPGGGTSVSPGSLRGLDVRSYLWRTVCLLPIGVVLCGGCLPQGFFLPSDPTEPLPTTKDIEPNDDIRRAVPISLDAAGRADFAGTVQSVGDVDVYDLGAVAQGQRIAVEVRAVSGSRLDAVAALLNADLELIDYSDDEDYDAGRLDSVIDHVVRHDTDHCYLGITNSGFGRSSGGYTATLQILDGASVPEPEGQPVLLDFDGATVTIPGDRTHYIGPFDAGEIDSRLDGRDDEAKEEIRDELEDRYSAYDIDFFTTDDAVLPDEGTYTRLVFGGESDSTFGIAQTVDHYNVDPTDEAIIFTDDWTDPFYVRPSTDALLTSIGNVAAHELGHLLGLEHTANDVSLMDSAGSADTILVPQEFMLAPLEDQIFPFGWQDAVELLLDILGPVDDSL